MAAFLRILEQVDPSSHLFRRSREVLESSLEAGPLVLPETPRGEPKFLTIGMATHNDYDGCYFTIQAIRMYHPEILDDVEFLVIDNDPGGPCAKALKQLEHFAANFRYIPLRSRREPRCATWYFEKRRANSCCASTATFSFPPARWQA